MKNIPVVIADAQSRTAPAPITITVQSPTCGVERWSVKVGTDPDAGLVNLGSPVRSTIAALRGIPAPASPPLNARVAPTETTVYLVNGIINVYKLEDDVDYHIVFQDPIGNTMVTEIPSPACDGSTSPFDAAVAAVRAKFDAHFSATSNFQTANLPVQMKGVGFFDFIHGQTGVAPNGIELHPILDFTFTTASTVTLSSSANPSVYGQPVNIIATVASAAGIPTGAVSFFDDGDPIGTSTIGANGQAVFTSSTLIAGTHTITRIVRRRLAGGAEQHDGAVHAEHHAGNPGDHVGEPRRYHVWRLDWLRAIECDCIGAGLFVYTPGGRHGAARGQRTDFVGGVHAYEQ